MAITMDQDELLDEDTLLELRDATGLLLAHHTEGWSFVHKEFRDDEGELIAAPTAEGQYYSHQIMAWLGY